MLWLCTHLICFSALLSCLGRRTNIQEKFALKGVVFLDEYLAPLGLGRNADDIMGLFQIDLVTICNFKNSSVMVNGHDIHPAGHLGPVRFSARSFSILHFFFLFCSVSLRVRGVRIPRPFGFRFLGTERTWDFVSVRFCACWSV